MFKYGYEEFYVDVQKMSKEIKKDYEPDAIIAIARGGVALGHFLAELLENRHLYTINSIHYEQDHKLDTIDIFNVPDLSKVNKILITDDIVDSGETMIEVKRVLHKMYPHLTIKVATVFYRERALMIPDFTARKATEWVNFFWDIRLD